MQSEHRLKYIYLNSKFVSLTLIIQIILQLVSQVNIIAAIEDTHDANPSLMVDTKHWLRNTNFKNKNNWLNSRKPCSFREEITINEKALILLGNILENNLKELKLASDGIILLQDQESVNRSDSNNSNIGSRYTTEDCIDDAEEHQSFSYEINSDEMSWFNPDNWQSEMLISSPKWIVDFLPESHLVPCNQDIVVISNSGSLNASHEELKSLVDGFKINFKPSIYSNISASSKFKSSSRGRQVRISKLKIGDNSYTQQEFEKLINSDKYDDILFDMSDTFSTEQDSELAISLRRPPPPLVIDESSLQVNTNFEFCLDEAGCLCGNEEDDIMELICSFRESVSLEEQPCLDPIKSAGYCNNICGSIIMILMDPVKFNERFVDNALNSAGSSSFERFDQQNILDAVFFGSRRVSWNQYELVFRPKFHEDTKQMNFWDSIQTQMDFSKAILKILDNAASKSFYGIKSIKLKSSENWKEGNRSDIFWASFGIIVTLNCILLVYKEIHSVDLESNLIDHTVNTLQRRFQRLHLWYSPTISDSIDLITDEAGLSKSDEFREGIEATEMKIVSRDTI